MHDRDEGAQSFPPDAPPTPLDRRGQDGAAGTGDMLGGTSAGAGGRLGPDADTGPAMPDNQHSFADADADPATDAARDDRGREDPA